MRVVEADLGEVAHGGYVVTRVAGKVIFVRGGLPGEKVRVEITETGKRFDRGIVVEVLDPHPERVQPRCQVANQCGGCDWQHASAVLQLELKRRVVAEQLRRLAGIDWQGSVQPVEPLWSWRTRMRYFSGEVLGMRGKRSHRIVSLPDQGCAIAVQAPPISPKKDCEIIDVTADSGRVVLAVDDFSGETEILEEQVLGRRYFVAANGFWQIHPKAAEMLCKTVVAGLQPKSGETAIDLYCGVGLFAGALANHGAKVIGVEVNKRAIELARRNVPEARFWSAKIERFLHKLPKKSDLVVLDPPRKGAGRDVVTKIAQLSPRAVSYVACDPASLARDIATFTKLGYEPLDIQAFDLFPQTHHVETVCLMMRVG